VSGKDDVKQDLIAGFRDQKLANSVVPCPDKTPNLLVSKVTFHDNHVVERDTFGDFPRPEWDMERSADEQAPVCYVRGATMKVTVELNVLGTRSYEGSVSIHGSARVGDVDMEWSEDVTLTPGDPTVTITQIAASAALPDHVGCYDPVTVTWETRPPGKARSPAGTSQHVVYALLGAPATVHYWTCIDISCRWGHGATSEAALVDQVFRGFKTLRLTRKRDGMGLTYWRPGLAWANGRRCVAFSVWLLLRGVHGRGQCGSWAELLVTTFRVHGVAAKKKKILPRRDAPYNAGGFLVKNWRYVSPPATSPTAYTHTMYQDCTDEPGLPGQRNPNPPGSFGNHFVAEIFGKYYDPSYGGGPFADEMSWQRPSLDGLISGSFQIRNVGFNEAQGPIVRFIDFPMVGPEDDHELPEED
jgi:hypothetical protein